MNKITKLLSVFVIAGAIGAGVVGAVGCGGKGGDDSGDGAHTSHTYTYTDQNNGKHLGTCSCGETDGPVDHTWGSDDVCTANGCNAVKPDLGVTSVTITNEDGTTIYEGGTLTLEATVETSKAGVSTDVTWSIAVGEQYATIEGNVLTANGVGSVYVVATSVADTTKKSEAIEIVIEERNIFADLTSDTENNIIGQNFNNASDFESGKLPVYSGYDSTTPGLYAWGNNDSMKATSSVTVADGKATHTPDSENIAIVAGLGDQVKDIVEGYVEMKFSAMGSKWAVLALKGTSDAVTTTDDVFSIYTTDGSGSIGCCLNKASADSTVAVKGLQLNTTDTYQVHFVLDMNSGLITVDIKTAGGTNFNLCTDLQTNIKTLKTVTFISSGSGSRFTTIDNIAVNSKAATLAQVQDSLKKRVDSYVAAATVDDTLELAGTNVTTAAGTVKDNIDAATTVEAAKAVTYNSIDEAILANAKTSAKALIDAISSTGYTGEALEDLNSAKDTAKGEIDKATTVAEVKEAYTQGKEDVEAVENDAARTTADVNITFTCTAASGIGGTLSKKDGETLTLAEVRKYTTGVSANKIVTGIKVDGAAVALPYTLAAVDEDGDGVKDATALTVEVVLSDYANLTATADCNVPTTATDADVENLGTEGFFTLTGCAKGTSGEDATKMQQGKLQNASVNSNTYAKQIGLTSGKVGTYANGAVGNSISFTVESACTVTIVCANAKDKTAAVSVLKKVTDEEGTTYPAATVTNIKKNGEAITEFDVAPKINDHVATDEVAATYEFTLEAGTYHIGGSGGGLLVFEISVIYTKPAQA